jgi:hypothetical protein
MLNKHAQDKERMIRWGTKTWEEEMNKAVLGCKSSDVNTKGLERVNRQRRNPVCDGDGD